MTKPRLFSTKEAAEYLGIHYATLKYHIYDKQRIQPDYMLSNDLVFTQDTLDAFAAKHQAEGLTMNEAAEYLGVNRSLVRYHVYDSKKLTPDGKRRNANVYRKTTLDRFRREVLENK